MGHGISSPNSITGFTGKSLGIILRKNLYFSNTENFY